MKRTDAARLIAGLRIGIGGGLLVLPGLATRIWAGPVADTPTARLLARAIGARDLFLGARLLIDGQAGRPTAALLQAGVAADAADALAAVLAARHLSPARRILVPVMAGVVAGAGWWAIEAVGATDTESDVAPDHRADGGPNRAEPGAADVVDPQGAVLDALDDALDDEGATAR